MPTFAVRVALGQSWCFQIGDDLEVQHAEWLGDIEPLARAWITEHHGVTGPAVRLRLELVTDHHRTILP
jgi:hypothetical protein